MNYFKDIKASRRAVLKAGAVSAGAAVVPSLGLAQAAARPAGAPVLASVSFTVNGKMQRLDVDTRTTLLDVLREQLHLTGTKKGCDHGQCGACTILLDGRRINACLTLAVMHEGAQITTIEGLGTPD